MLSGESSHVETLQPEAPAVRIMRLGVLKRIVTFVAAVLAEQEAFNAASDLLSDDKVENFVHSQYIITCNFEKTFQTKRKRSKMHQAPALS